MTPAALAANRRNLEKARAARSRAAKAKEASSLSSRRRTPTKIARKKLTTVKAETGKLATKSIKVKEEMVTLYHRTTPSAARKIVKEGFVRDPKNAITDSNNGEFGVTSNYTYFSKYRDGASKDYGLALVSIKVPKRLVEIDPEPPEFDSPKSRGWVRVKSTELSKINSKRRASGLDNPGGTGWYSFMTAAAKRKKMAAYRAKHPKPVSRRIRK